MLNDIFKHSCKLHMEDCDFLAELTRIKDKLVETNEEAAELWEECFEPEMEYTHESKDADIKRLFDLVYTMGGIEGEIQVDGCEFHFEDSAYRAVNPEEEIKDTSLPLGYCEDTLGTGKPSIGFMLCSCESYVQTYHLCYFDGEKFRLFTPYLGNPVNVITKTALGDEHLVPDKDRPAMIQSEEARKIFEGYDASTVLFNQDTCGVIYITYFNPDFEFDDDAGWFEITDILPDFEGIRKELRDAIL